MSSRKSVSPKPFLKWVGGKRQLLSELLRAVDSAGEFNNYFEPFLGGGAVFFSLAHDKRIRGRSNLSDINGNLIDAYLGVRDHVERVISILREHKHNHSETYFYDVRSRSPRTLAQRAARIIYLNKTCYNGLYRENSKGQFNVPFGRYKNPNICDAGNLRAVSETLKSANIVAGSFTEVLSSVRRGDLVYFDPPYSPISRTADFTSYSREGFNASAQIRLGELFAALAEMGAKVILSNSMTNFTKALYKDFYIYEVYATRLVNSRSDRRGRIAEALITNFKIDLVDGENTLEINGRQYVSPKMRMFEVYLAKKWLYENGYKDIVRMMDEVTGDRLRTGKDIRQDWWNVLAGNSKGLSKIVSGRKFPVLKAAQELQGKPVTKNALRRNLNETPPPQTRQG